MTTRVLLTNDDGVRAAGLEALRRELARLDDVDLRVVAPDGNRSATARAITVRRPLVVRDAPFEDGTSGLATDGMPTDCVRLALHGIFDDWRPDLVVSGINHGANAGDDVTYSGTVAAALEAVIHDIPAVAISMSSPHGEWALREEYEWDFGPAAEVGARIVAGLDDVPLPPSTILNVNVPQGDPSAVEVTRLGRRRYSDELALVEELEDGGRSYWLYGTAQGAAREDGTDLTALAEGRVSITPLHLELTRENAIESLAGHGFEHVLRRVGELLDD